MLSLKTLDILSAIVFSAPGMWLEEIQKPQFCANSHLRFAISLQITECMPPILCIVNVKMYANAVLLSIQTDSVGHSPIYDLLQKAECFTAGNIHNHLSQWKFITSNQNWLKTAFC